LQPEFSWTDTAAGENVSSVNALFSDAIVKAGPILIVTAEGNVRYGINSTGVGEEMGKLLAGTNAGLFVPFLIALIMKTAQGSSTVAIITTASFVLPMIPVLGWIRNGGGFCNAFDGSRINGCVACK
jgi:GntP family gluconate:H+ symporter